MTSVGDYLKKEREARHLSVQEVAALTKISERYLACIECGQYDQLPPGPYAKGYIAAYARQVCGDESQALELYSGCRAAAPTQATASVTMEEEPLGDTAAFPPQNGNGGSKWQAKMATGLSIARSLRQALPEKGNLKHLSQGSAKKEKPSLTARLQVLLGKVTAVASHFPKGLLVKGGLVAGLMLVCAVVLVFAGFGAYHLFVFKGSSEFSPAPQSQAKESPSPAEVNTGDTLTATAATAESGSKAAKVSSTTSKNTPEAASTPSAKAPPHKTKKVRKPSKTEPSASPPPAATAAALDGPHPSPAVLDQAADRPAEPLENVKGEALATAAAPQPAAGVAPPQQMDTVAAGKDIPVELVKASVCTSIEERMPAGVSKVFPWTTHKIYVWSLLSAKKPPAKVRHIYYHAGRMVSDVTLTVGSSHWRTWSFHTLSGQLHIGPWHIDVATMDGRVMRRLHFEIQ